MQIRHVHPPLADAEQRQERLSNLYRSCIAELELRGSQARFYWKPPQLQR